MKVVEQSFKKDIPPIRIGDTLSISIRVKEGDKERVQAFEGTLIGRRGDGTRETITVRKISSGIGVERILPLHSPLISKIEIVKKAKVRQAKLYYLRDKKGKAAKLKEHSFNKK